MADSPSYEVILISSEISMTRSDWTWRRFERDGSISARGSRSETMKACFAEIHRHKIVAGEASITVNLRGDRAPGPTDVAATPQRFVSMPNATLKRRLKRQVALRH